MFVIPLYLFGEDLVFCFVLALLEIFGSLELCQIHFLLRFQAFVVKTEINKQKIDYADPDQCRLNRLKDVNCTFFFNLLFLI